MPRQVTFCLCPGFSLFSIASALDVFRHANRFLRQDYYHWQILSETDSAVADSNGIPFTPDCRVVDATHGELAFIVAGFDASQIQQPILCQWLTEQTHSECIIGGISNGAFLLAASGLLEGYSATTHWEDFESFCMLFPDVRARYQRYVIDRRRITCAGGSATLDLFIELARQDLGNEIALKISRQMLLQEQFDRLPGQYHEANPRLPVFSPGTTRTQPDRSRCGSIHHGE